MGASWTGLYSLLAGMELTSTVADIRVLTEMKFGKTLLF